MFRLFLEHSQICLQYVYAFHKLFQSAKTFKPINRFDQIILLIYVRLIPKFLLKK